MPKFYFNIRNRNEVIEDHDGTDLIDLSAAREEAVLSARDMLADGSKIGEVISNRQYEICDKLGKCLAIVPFAAALRFH